MTYAEKLQDPRWQKKRLEILNRDNWTCQLCKDTETTLHVHHIAYAKSRNPWDSDDFELIAYCECCHALITELEKINNDYYLSDITKTKNGKDSSLVCMGSDLGINSLIVVIAKYENKGITIEAIITSNKFVELNNLLTKWMPFFLKHI